MMPLLVDVELNQTGWLMLARYDQPAADRQHFIYADSKPVQVRQQTDHARQLHTLRDARAVAVDAGVPCCLSVRAISTPALVSHGELPADRPEIVTNGSREPIDCERLRRICQWRHHYARELPSHAEPPTGPRPQLTDDERELIIQLRQDGETLNAIAVMMDCAYSTVFRIVKQCPQLQPN